MIFSRDEERTVRAHYHYWRLRFNGDGTVSAQKRPGGAWGILYTRAQARAHADVVRGK